MVDTPIGTNSPNYTLVSGDVGATIFCRVTATNASGSAQAFSNAVGPVAAAAAPSFSTWSTTDKYETATSTLVFSDGNKTVTGMYLGGATSKVGMRGTASNATGKKYFELTMVTKPSTPDSCRIGICDATFGLSTGNSPGSSDNTGVNLQLDNPNFFAYQSDGAIYVFTALTTASGDVYGFAVDLDLAGGTMWFRNNGTWVRGDPVAATDGLAWGAGSADAMFPYLILDPHLTSVADGVFTINTGGSAFAHTIPTGYTAWG